MSVYLLGKATEHDTEVLLDAAHLKSVGIAEPEHVRAALGIGAAPKTDIDQVVAQVKASLKLGEAAEKSVAEIVQAVKVALHLGTASGKSVDEIVTAVRTALNLGDAAGKSVAEITAAVRAALKLGDASGKSVAEIVTAVQAALKLGNAAGKSVDEIVAAVKAALGPAGGITWSSSGTVTGTWTYGTAPSLKNNRYLQGEQNDGVIQSVLIGITPQNIMVVGDPALALSLRGKEDHPKYGADQMALMKDLAQLRSDITKRTITAAPGLEGGGDLSQNRTIALNADTKKALALAGHATQPDTNETINGTWTWNTSPLLKNNRYVHGFQNGDQKSFAMLGVTEQNAVHVGSAEMPLQLAGSEDRPHYGTEQLALRSEIPHIPPHLPPYNVEHNEATIRSPSIHFVTTVDRHKYSMQLRGADGALLPGVAELQALGGANLKWSTVFAKSGTVQGSDENEKQDIEPIPDAVLDAWAEVEWTSYRWRDAVAEKGEAARKHTGVIAQRVEAAFQRHSLDARELGVLCIDPETETVTETQTVEGEQVEVNTERETGRQLYSLRYDEAFALEAALVRRELAKLKQGKAS